VSNLFEMRLEDIPFVATSDGLKKIEVRLDDSRRNGLSKGDSIKFIHIGSGKELVKKVLTVRKYKSLEDLVALELFENTGGIYQDRHHWFHEISRYYPKEKIHIFGLLVIEFAEDNT